MEKESAEEDSKNCIKLKDENENEMLWNLKNDGWNNENSKNGSRESLKRGVTGGDGQN